MKTRQQLCNNDQRNLLSLLELVGPAVQKEDTNFKHVPPQRKSCWHWSIF